ncbi:hypothetical protein LCGC14_3053430, partial [marine sediment metagenome]
MLFQICTTQAVRGFTSITENGKGVVLGGKPIRHTDVIVDLGIERTHYVNWITRLRREGYIETKRTPYGLVISVNKAQKRFSNLSLNKQMSRGLTSKSTKKKEMSINESEMSINETGNKYSSSTESSKLPKTSFDLEKELSKMSEDTKRFIQIIGLWIKEKHLVIENKEQLQVCIKRNLKAAQNLNGYTNVD